ncbi:hypothetical protein [Silvanigrella aquatica]|uniref:Uncharacterized protein n=1 Tax=Silvanigrella aquatica TaxID=1915309 RepID=A0A1L4CZQ5_9BACT|nr:hypothetical protein [Silvanigrella aquatica]APJ03431.1 hypothetical protein AXG55_05735 [Silvanigrella aquatica]
MANSRLKKTESTKRHQHEPVEETPPQTKEEPFLDHSAEDELTRKRKLILTGITAGVAVAGATAAGLLFLGPYSPFGGKSPEKQDNIIPNPTPTPPHVEDKSAVQVTPPPVVAEPSHPAVVAAPAPRVKEHVVQKPVESAPTPSAPSIIAVVPPPAVDSIEKPKKQKAPKPLIAPTESSGPLSYNYDIQDGGPIVQLPSQKKILVSRDPRFNKIYLNGNSSATGQYRISIPPPGDIYWKEAGKPAHKITILPPTSSGLRADFPPQMKINDSLTWSATGKVSFYRIEVASDQEFLNRVKVYSTTKTTFPVGNIGLGKWFIRISSLNLQSGTWDSTKVYPINIEDVPKPVPTASVAPEQAAPDASQNTGADAPQEEPRADASEAAKIENKDAPVTPSAESTEAKPVELVKPVEATVPDAPSPPTAP